MLEPGSELKDAIRGWFVLGEHPMAPNRAFAEARHFTFRRVLMAVVIRSKATGRFYAGFNRWLTEPDGAFDFQKEQTAAGWIETVGLSDVTILIQRNPRHEPRAVIRVSRRR